MNRAAGVWHRLGAQIQPPGLSEGAKADLGQDSAKSATIDRPARPQCCSRRWLIWGKTGLALEIEVFLSSFRDGVRARPWHVTPASLHSILDFKTSIVVFSQLSLFTSREDYSVVLCEVAY